MISFEKLNNVKDFAVFTGYNSGLNEEERDKGMQRKKLTLGYASSSGM
jgi:hypothetical protein